MYSIWDDQCCVALLDGNDFVKVQRKLKMARLVLRLGYFRYQTYGSHPTKDVRVEG